MDNAVNTRSRNKKKAVLVIAYILLVLFVLFDLIPLIWMILCSFKSRTEIMTFPPAIFPSEWRFDNYVKAWNAYGLSFTRMFINTFTIVIPGTFFTVLSATLAAYSFARIKFWGRDFLFALFLLSLMIPDSVVLIPRFIFFKNLGFQDSLWPIIIPMLFGYGLPVFLGRQFFMTIPQDLEDSATIDGCGRLRAWANIFVPLSKPIIATITVFTFQSYYNDFLYPLVYINSTSKFTIQLGLSAFRGEHTTRFDLLMAASVFCLIPILIIYMFAQRYFVEGIVTTGLKG